MLKKKELLAIEPCKFEQVESKGYNRYVKYAEFAQIVRLPQSGHITAVDFYERQTQKLCLRSFYDGKNVVNYSPPGSAASYSPPGGGWSDAKPGSCLGGVWGGGDCISSPGAKKILEKLQTKKKRWCSDTVSEYLGDVVSEKGLKKRQRAEKRERELFEALTAMLPEYPKQLPAYCERNIYGSTYIFIGKIQHKQRTAVCAHCGHAFTVNKSIKPHQHGKCPKCGEEAEYYADWTMPPKEKKRRVCICCKSSGNLIIRWAKIKRSFYGQKTQYDFDDYYWNFYIHSGEKSTLYAYHWVDNMGYGNWVRLRNGTENNEATYLYMSNLRQVFGSNMYGVDLAGELQGCEDKISITRMLDSLKNVPQAKYFLHMGLKRLAQDMWDPPYMISNSYTGKTFEEVFGVRAQYFPLYKKHDVTMTEHAAIKACEAWVDEDMFLKMREMDVREYEIARHNGFLKTAATIKKSINYLYKQFKQHEGQTFGQLADYWHDYLEMSAVIKVDISNKQIKFPKDLLDAHNILSVRTASIKDKIRAEKVKKAFQTIYTGIQAYRTGKYQIVFPRSEADFLREGQQLNHCVGNGTYFNRHIEGINMIFFIRKVAEPEKPFFTAEVNVEKRTIVQLYGDHDCQAPKEIRNFVEQFAKRIEPRGETVAEKERKSA